MDTKQPFIVLIFPTDKDRASLASLAARVKAELKDACGQAPQIILPDMTAICLLADGEPDRISAALERASAMGTRYLIARLEKPYAALGLSATVSWLKTHLGS